MRSFVPSGLSGRSPLLSFEWGAPPFGSRPEKWLVLYTWGSPSGVFYREAWFSSLWPFVWWLVRFVYLPKVSGAFFRLERAQVWGWSLINARSGRVVLSDEIYLRSRLRSCVNGLSGGVVRFLLGSFLLAVVWVLIRCGVF